MSGRFKNVDSVMTTFVTLSTMAPRALKRTFTVLAASILTLSIIAPKGA